MYKQNNKLFTWFCIVLISSCLFINIDARKVASSNTRRKTQSSSSNSGRVSKPDTSHADQAKLSYSNYNSAPNPPRHQAPSAPAAPPKAAEPAKPIGWNVPPQQNVQKQSVSNTNSAPFGSGASYPGQQQPHAGGSPPYPGAGGSYGNHGAPPPPYSQHTNNGPPPPYSAGASAPVNSNFNQAPPPYSSYGSGSQYPG